MHFNYRQFQKDFLKYYLVQLYGLVSLYILYLNDLNVVFLDLNRKLSMKLIEGLASGRSSRFPVVLLMKCLSLKSE